MKLLVLSTCPCCGAKVTEPVEICRRCDCNLLLLCKIRNEAIRLAADGKVFQSNALCQASSILKTL